MGICSYTDGKVATVVCPWRFRQDGRLFVDAGRAAFGAGKRILAVPEVRLLEVPETRRKIGKIDYLIALLDDRDEPIDFAAVEVQAVYISGATTRPPFDHYLNTGELRDSGRRRPDFRSSAQKRLMPQLSLKVPVFRRWGKRFFVAVDAAFFAELPKLPTVPEGNSEITWLVYPFAREDSGFAMQEPVLYHTLWDDVLTSLREGTPPTREALLGELKKAKKSGRIFST
ncbi:MAG TPA: NotI family restriction endonuclease [Acidobacteriaceae bacterium]|nr:NotI family restriction endonuclease [Acidobacteriaceae bacterium]